jgi:hypothetical protein
MSFKSYAVTALPEGGLLLDDPQPLVFSGRHGLIARFVLSAGERAQSRWALCAGELHALSSPALQLGERMIVFEQSEDNAIELLALKVIQGCSAERTEMMFSFEALHVLRRAPRLCVEELDTGRTYIEELSLEGGVYAPAASWHWRRPHLALGGVLCRRDSMARVPNTLPV